MTFNKVKNHISRPSLVRYPCSLLCWMTVWPRNVYNLVDCLHSCFIFPWWQAYVNTRLHSIGFHTFFSFLKNKLFHWASQLVNAGSLNCFNALLGALYLQSNYMHMLFFSFQFPPPTFPSLSSLALGALGHQYYRYVKTTRQGNSFEIYSETLVYLNMAFTVLFSIESVLKILAFGPKVWNTILPPSYVDRCFGVLE